MTRQYHFCGVGGSGMLPLAAIVRASGATVSGSDRALDGGRLAAKFAYLEDLGITLFPQDGSGLRDGATLVTSAAVEDSIPDVVRAAEIGLERMTRPQLLAELLNGADTSVAVGGTSGKSTVTGMVGWMLHEMGKAPTVMNGAVMKNFVTDEAPFASALVGNPKLFVSEVDESDGSIALYRPTVAVLGNISLDHKSMSELRSLFGAFLSRAKKAVVNLDDPETRAIAEALPADHLVSFGLYSPGATLSGLDLKLGADDTRFVLAAGPDRHEVALPLPGRHNVMNALAALGAVHALGHSLSESVAALAGFKGLKRRLDVVGQARSVTVIDDFAHNPDKVAATLATLSRRPGRLLVMFQPHGYGPLRQMGEELARTFASGLGSDDRLYLPDPVYQGGTVDKSRGSDWLAGAIGEAGGTAIHLPTREAIGEALVAEAREGDTIAILGARDDTLSEFAADLVRNIGARR